MWFKSGALQPFDLWGAGTWFNQEVVGESQYLPALQSLLPRRAKQSEEIELHALLVQEPSNRHDPNAVMVAVDSTTIGYLPRDVAPHYAGLLAELTRTGLVARVPCRIAGYMLTDYATNRRGDLIESERFSASVTIALAEPHLCVPRNRPPSSRFEMLPRGTAIQVTGEQDHLASITPFMLEEGEWYVYVTLHEIESATGREVVEVRINGDRVGQLTPKMSAELLPAIRHLERSGSLTAARAKVRGNHLKAEVTLHCARTHELATDWLSDVAATQSPTIAVPEQVQPAAWWDVPGLVPPKPVLRFTAPPGWPPPPTPDWEPPVGWRPNPDWPQPPSDWVYWVLDPRRPSD